MLACVSRIPCARPHGRAMCRLQLLNATEDEEIAMAAAATTIAKARSESGAVTKGKQTKKRSRTEQLSSGSKRRAVGQAGAEASADDAPLLQGFHLLAMEEGRDDVLLELQPLFVVLYDLDLAWIRRLELYQSLDPSRPIKVRRHSEKRCNRCPVSSPQLHGW